MGERRNRTERVMKPIVVVVGMKRSGTSLLCQALERLGVSFGSPLIGPDKANVRGYYEHKGVVHNQTLLMQTCYDRRGWSDIGELVELNEAGTVGATEALQLNIENIVKDEVEERELFGLKLPYLTRIPAVWGSIFLEVGVEPIYIHAMRCPVEVYASILTANGTEHKDTEPNYRKYWREWAWTNAELFKLPPACEIWFSDWKQGRAAEMMKKLADAVGLETVSTEGLLL